MQPECQPYLGHLKHNKHKYNECNASLLGEGGGDEGTQPVSSIGLFCFLRGLIRRYNNLANNNW